MGLVDEIVHSFTLFNRDRSQPIDRLSIEDVSTYEPNRTIPRTRYNQASFVTMLYTRIAMDVAACTFQHVTTDKTNGKRVVIENSDLQRIFEVEANLDQTSTDFFHDLAYSLFDEGVVAVVPTKTDVGLNDSGSFKIHEMRVGKIVEWYPTKVKVKLYNDFTGDFSEVVLEKRNVAIIENPLDDIVGRNNPTLRRLIDKLAMLDTQDREQMNSKLNMILQLPNPVRTDARRDIANKRVKDIEDQLVKSKMGIAYAGPEEKITQISKNFNNGLLDEVKYLTDEMLAMLGISRKVFNGEASDAEMRNYYARTIEPITTRIKEEFQRKFITKTAYTQGQRIFVYMDPFNLTAVGDLASVMDTLLRNSVITPNEARSKMGLGPSDNPLADELYNRNIADSNQEFSSPTGGEPYPEEEVQEPYPKEEVQEPYPDSAERDPNDLSLGDMFRILRNRRS